MFKPFLEAYYFWNRFNLLVVEKLVQSIICLHLETNFSVLMFLYNFVMIIHVPPPFLKE